MRNGDKKTLGIIGGMGPMATVDLFKKIIALTGAENDRQNIHILIDNNTNIPDRTESILCGGESPVFEMARSAVKLEAMGADALLIACNTAHYYYDDICKYVNIPIIHMIKETATEALRLGLGATGLLATEGTLKSGIYEKALNAVGVRAIAPSENGRAVVMSLIYDIVKAGKSAVSPPLLAAFLKELEQMKSRGARMFILGCTELPLAFEMLSIDEIFLDPTTVLAKKAVLFAKGRG